MNTQCHLSGRDTPPLSGANIACDAVNVSDKTVDIVITIIGSDGLPLTINDSTGPMALPGMQVTSAHHEADVTHGIDGYCKFEVFGTSNRDKVRVDLTATVKRNISQTDPPVPVWVFRQVQGY